MGDDRLESVVAEHGLVGLDLVEAFALGAPTAFAELEERGGMAWAGLAEQVEVRAVEMDADQGEENASLAVTRPEDLVVPVRILPADALEGIDAGQPGEEAGLVPFALLAKQRPCVIDAPFLGKKPDGAADDGPDDDETGRRERRPQVC